MSFREKSEAELFCEIKEAFQIFDRDNDGIITKEEEQTILRMFGINTNEKEEKKDNKKDDKKPKEGEQENPEEENPPEPEEGKTPQNGNVEEEKEEVKEEKVEFNEFFDNIQKKLKDSIKDNEILEDIDNGYILPIRELEHDLQNSKERISNALINKIIKDSTPDGGNFVVYEDFVKVMLNKS